jgi:hypothetical protein
METVYFRTRDLFFVERTMRRMIVLLAVLSLAPSSSAAFAQAPDEVPVAVAAIEFATREFPSTVALLIDTRRSQEQAAREVARTLGASVGDLESVMACPQQAPVDRCRMSAEVAVAAFEALPSRGDHRSIEVRLWSRDPFRGGVHHSVIGLELEHQSEGWEVTKVLRRGAT